MSNFYDPQEFTSINDAVNKIRHEEQRQLSESVQSETVKVEEYDDQDYFSDDDAPDPLNSSLRMFSKPGDSPSDRDLMSLTRKRRPKDVSAASAEMQKLKRR